MALNNKSGIEYTTGDNGSVNGVQYANKIVTINDSDYFLLDAHTLDWNKSKLTYLSGSDYQNTTLTSIRDKFFAIGGDLEEPLNRRRYFENETPSYSSDGKVIPMPNWYDGDHPNKIYDSAELLDVIDYLACLAHSAIKEIDGLKNQLDKDKAVLTFDENDITKLGGKIDSSGNVSSFPITFELKPNQTNSDYVSTQTVKKFYNEIERRNIGFKIYVYTAAGEPITDDEILYKAGLDQTGNKVSGLLWTFSEGQIASGTKVSSEQRLDPNKNYSTGCFLVDFSVQGWDPQFTAKTIHPNKTLNFTDVGKSDMYDYSANDRKSIDFTAMTQTTKEHRQSDPRTLNFILKKTFNSFDRVFICGEEYVYLDETFFNGQEGNSAFDSYIYGESAEMSTLTYRLTYLLKKSLIPVTLDKLTPAILLQYNLLSSLILVTNEFFNKDMLIKGVNVTNDTNIIVEIYPKYYGIKSKIQQINRVRPGSYEETDNEDGKNHNSYDDKNLMYESNSCMAPLACIDYPHSSTYEINSSGSRVDYFTYPDNEKKGNNVTVCDYCEREIDGVKRSGYKFSFKMTSSSATLLQNIIEYNRTHNDKKGYLDIIFGTTATRYVAASFIKIRFYLAASSQVYFIDMTKDYSSTGTDWNDRNKLETQWQQSKKITNELGQRYGLGVNTSNKTLLFTESNIKKNALDEYEWDLSLPIFSYWSWAPQGTNVGSNTDLSTIYSTVIAPSSRNYEAISQTSPQNVLSDTTGPQKLPLSFDRNAVYDKYKYSYGFPTIPIGIVGTGTDYSQIQNLLLIKAISIDYDTNKKQEGRRDISHEIEIDYASTYSKSTNFINTLSKDIKSKLTGSDEEKGKFICSYFCGFEIRNGVKYFTMIHPTIGEDYLKPFYTDEKYSDIYEWEDELKRDGSVYKDCGLKVALRVPEVTASVQNGISVNHSEGKLTLNLNVHRAYKHFAGWAARRDMRDSGVAASTAVNCGQPVTKKSFIGTTGFGTNNAFNMQTRNDGKYYIFNDISSNVQYALQKDKTYKTVSIKEFMANSEKVHKFNAELTNGELINVYCKQTDDEFTLYRTENFNASEVTDEDIQYKVDTVIPFNLKYVINGNEWFKGYTAKSPTERLSQDIFLYNKQNNYIKLITKNNPNDNSLYDLGSDSNKSWVGGLPQAFTTTTISNIGTLESGNYMKLDKTISYKDLKDDLDNWYLSFLDFGQAKLITLNNEASSVTNLSEFYGPNWQDYVKLSMTASIKSNTEGSKFPTMFEDIINLVPTENTINLYIRKIDGTAKWELYREYGYNMFYESGEVINDIDDYFYVNGTFDHITMKQKLKDYITNRGKGGFVLGMNVCIMFPMTHIYRGKFFIIRLLLEVTE